MTQSITVQLVQDASGRIDQAASLAAFETSLSALVANVETENTEIAAKVAVLFDQNMGKHIAMPTVGSLTANLLGAVSENYRVLSERVCDYVRANSDGKGSDTFTIVRGAGGGVGRKSDLPAKAAK